MLTNVKSKENEHFEVFGSHKVLKKRLNISMLNKGTLSTHIPFISPIYSFCYCPHFFKLKFYLQFMQALSTQMQYIKVQ